VGTADADQVLDRIIAQALDQQTYQRRPPVSVPPGATVLDPQTLAPVYIAPPTPRTLSTRELHDMTAEGTQFGNISRLAGSFNDRWTLPGITATVNAGDYANWFARHMTGPPDQRTAAAAWWQDYARNVDLVERHAMFGASLTASEQASWRAASITPNMRPDLIRQHLATRRQILQAAIQRYTRSLVIAGYDPNAIAAAYGVNADSLRLFGAGQQPTTGPGTTAPTTGPGTTPPPSRPPPRPSNIPPGSQWSASRQQWRTSDGRIFDAQGRPVQQ
jgi:hypothetical protein